MPTSAARVAPAPSITYHDVLSDDGTRLTAWTNDPNGAIDGPTVVLCNGLGTGPWTWPALLRPDCAVRIISWNHRGTGGSDRPADPAHCGIEAFVEDTLSVMDHFGVDRAPVMGWSMGVNTMFELAFRHPERVSGLFAGAEVSGDTFATMLAPFKLPRLIAHEVTVNIARVLKLTGRAISPVTTRLPVGPRTIAVLTHSGFMLPVPDPEGLTNAVRELPRDPHRVVHAPRHRHLRARPGLAEQDQGAHGVRRRQVGRAGRLARHGLRGRADPGRDVRRAGRQPLRPDGAAGDRPRAAAGVPRPDRLMHRPVLAAAALVLVAAGCSQGGDEVNVNVNNDGTPPVGTASAGASGPGPQVIETVATGLEVPWGLAFLPDGDAVVTERDSAKVLVISGSDHAVTEVGHIGDAAPQGEGGLLGVAVSPAFDQDQTLYFYASSENDNRIVTATLNDGQLSATKPIFTGIPLGPIHDGGRLAFGPDGMLYASTGETGNGEIAQDRDSLGGKILRLTPAGKPAPGNPFDTAVWSFGHRNVQGLAFVDGQLWASEFGQNTFDKAQPDRRRRQLRLAALRRHRRRR